MKLKRFQYLIYLVFIVILGGLSCSGLQFEGLGYNPKSPKENFINSLKYFSATPDGQAKRNSLIKEYRFLEIFAQARDPIAQKYFSQIQTMNAYTQADGIDSLIQLFKDEKDFYTSPQTPNQNEWWDTMWVQRASHCDQHYHKPGKEWWDLRAKPVLLHGFPDEEFWEHDDTCQSVFMHPQIQQLTTCPTYYMHWVNKGIFLAYQEYKGDIQAVWSKYDPGSAVARDEPKTTRMMYTGREQAKHVTNAKPDFSLDDYAERVINFSLSVSCFPELNGDSNTIWLSIGLPLDQFKPDSSGLIWFHASTIIRDELFSPVLADSGGWIFIPADQGMRWTPLYATYKLAKGKYRLALTINDRHKGLGVYPIEFRVPPFDKPISDMLLSRLPAKNDDWLPWIRRQGNVQIMDSPFSFFSPGDTVYPYFEYKTNNFSSDSFKQYHQQILFTLYPVEKGLKKPEITFGPIYVIKPDSVKKVSINQEIILGKWEKGYSICSFKQSTGLALGIFTGQIQIPWKVPVGEYFLVVLVRDDYKKDNPKAMFAWRRVLIEKKQ